LVATEPSLRSALAVGERVTASSARVRVVIDDLIDLILRLQLTPGAPMPRLTTSLASLPLPPCEFLRLLTRLRTPLLTCLRRILRRWL
jgi:hypothetical protein